MDKIETDCIWLILKSQPALFFLRVWRLAQMMTVVLAQNNLVCDVPIILSVKDFNNTISEFEIRN